MITPLPDFVAFALPYWRRMDNVVLLWILGTLTIDL
jgi:hypothetical protein